MKVTELDTRDVTVIRTEKRYVLNEKVFELDTCPDWAQYAAVDEDGAAYFYRYSPCIIGHGYNCNSDAPWEYEKYIQIGDDDPLFDATDWQHSLIKRSERKVLEVTMADIEKQFGCKVKIVKEK